MAVVSRTSSVTYFTPGFAEQCYFRPKRAKGEPGREGTAAFGTNQIPKDGICR